MNYLAHGYRFTQDPYFLAGTAAPDWLSVIDRKMRLRSKTAAQFVDDPDPTVAAIARGIVQHHHDDGWFHQTEAFATLSLSFAMAIRRVLSADDGFRPSFLGHILVELLLDAILVKESPQRLEDYYQAIAALDPIVVQEGLNKLATRPSERIAILIPRFHQERFLADYGEDAPLLMRLNHVMRRVGLPLLPEGLQELFPELRSQVHRRRRELLAGID
ncbi:MAG: hypothetical protein MUF06_09960 [Pirellulaceae bacterium]|jgi:hypothetical protein|nr:hypothetical protein [Pirellulaceae bacterium]